MFGNLKENLFKNSEKILQMVLWLVAIHSLGMGLTLIAQPTDLMKFAGFNPDCDHFFPAQGGVFHLLMFVVYSMGATHIEKYHNFIVFSIFVKSAASFFLMIYSFAVEFKWIVFLSGIIDCVMGLMIFLSFQLYLRSKKYSFGYEK